MYFFTSYLDVGNWSGWSEGSDDPPPLPFFLGGGGGGANLLCFLYITLGRRSVQLNPFCKIPFKTTPLEKVRPTPLISITMTQDINIIRMDLQSYWVVRSKALRGDEYMSTQPLTLIHYLISGSDTELSVIYFKGANHKG